MDERVEKPKKKRVMTEAQKDQLRANMAKARAVRLERIKKKKLENDLPGVDATKLPGEGAVEILRRLVMILCSRFADGRMDKRSCLLCEMRIPPNIENFENPCPCQSAWKYVDFIDRRDQEKKDAERREAS